MLTASGTKRRRCAVAAQLTIPVVGGWVIWVWMLSKRRKRNPKYQEQQRLKFMAKQRQKAGANQK
jgi:hypothetical protein